MGSIILVIKMLIGFVFYIFILCVCQSESKDAIENQRQEKVFSLFTVVTFPNDQCTAKSTPSMYGTCYAESECTSKGGTVDGNCAAGFGVCCTFTLSACPSTVTQNCTYITNPSYPTTYTTTGNCIFSVTPISADICQFRLDFDDFDLVETAAGVCTDSFIMGGQTGVNPMNLCGTLTGMHVYVESGRVTTATDLTFNIQQTAGVKWKTKITQIECSNLARAPEGCNQYFTGVSGTFQSYNYPTLQLTNRIYSYCIRREAGYCGIQYQAGVNGAIDTFKLDSGANFAAVNGFAGIVTGDAEGYLLIPGGTGTIGPDQFSGDVLCSSDSSQAAIACAGTAAISPGGTVVREGPMFHITHVSMADGGTAGNVGFLLTYAQLPCNGVNPKIENAG